MNLKNLITRLLPRIPEGWQIDIATRYLPIVKEIENKKESVTILEVGSGPTGITAYLNRSSIVALDPDFSESPSDKLRAVIGDVSHLPFPDKQFDLIVSVDMLEHVAPEARARCISEMIRVARHHVYLAVPTGRLAEVLDAKLDRYYLSRKGERYPFLTEHVEHGLPTKHQIIDTIYDAANQEGTKVRIRIKGNANIFARYLWMAAWIDGKAWQEQVLRNSLRFWRYFRFLDCPPVYRHVFKIDRLVRCDETACDVRRSGC